MKPPQLSHERVLLVDDDPVARLLTASILTRHGFFVSEADSGREALEKFTLGPDCVLLDALMPGMDGFATCRALRQLPGGAQVPVLMLTGLDDDESVAHAYEAGATDFFVKSTQWTLLVQRTRYLLRAARMRGELETSRAKLARAQRIARLGTWEWDLRSGLLVGSELCWSILGIAGTDVSLSLKAFLALVHDDDRKELRRPANNPIWPKSCRPNGLDRHPCVPGTTGETAPPSRPWKAVKAPASKLAARAPTARAIECRSLPAGRSSGRFQPSTPTMDRAQSWTQYLAIVVPDDRFRMPEGYEFST